MIFDMYVNKDMGMPSIANHLNSLGVTPPNGGGHWSNNGLKDLLMNVHYLGKVKWNWRKTITIVEDSEIIQVRPKKKIGEYLIYEGKHEAIISEELFNAAQEKMGRNHKAKVTTKVRNPLASLVYCQCGRAMSLRMHKKKDGSDRYAPRLLCDGQIHCHTGSCTYDEMLDLVINVLEQCIADFEYRIKNNQDDAMKLHEKLLKSLEKKMQDLEAKELSQWESQSHPDPAQRMPPDIFKRLNEKLLKEKEEVKEAMCNARKSMPNPEDYREKLVRFQTALDALRNPDLSAEEKNRFLKACIERIEYNRQAPTRTRRKPGEKKGTTIKTSGGHWDSHPIEIDVKLRV